MQSFEKNLDVLLSQENFTQFEYQLPDEYRLDILFKNYCAQLKIPNSVNDTEHFFSTREELGNFFEGKKMFLMESFYRAMRKKHNVLMDGDKPKTGQWNYDGDNRKKLPKDHKATTPLVFNNDVTEIFDQIQKANVKTIGSIGAKHFVWPIDRTQSLALLDFFVAECLPLFGSYQDAMTPNEWSLYHSRISFSMNVKMISPKEVIDRAVQEWENRKDEIEYNQLEGFVRQIIGWREYMRGIYWLKMPEFATLNFFNHTEKLPDWFWTGKTKMNCLKDAITQSLEYAYAHHIQRLMVTGNFAMLAGIAPQQVDQWYLGIYIDAIEWVEMPNTRGMSQFADGGLIATKPYAASGSYINKMSDYCKGCHYSVKERTTDNACPFNSLYWHFMQRHGDSFSKNPRTAMAYRSWEKMADDVRKALLQRADYCLANLNSL